MEPNRSRTLLGGLVAAALLAPFAGVSCGGNGAVARASAGTLALSRSGRAEAYPASRSGNSWRALAAPGPAHLWAVVRDARGGVAFAGRTVEVQR